MSSPTLSFDGTDDYIDTTAAANFGTNAFSVASWVYFNSGGDNTILSTYEGEGFIHRSSGGNYQLWLNGNTFNGGAITTGTWVHFCSVRKSDGSVEIYVDGELDSSFSPSSIDVSNNTNVRLGMDPASTRPHDGGMDDVRLFNTALTAEEVQSVMDGQVLGSEVALWSMNEGTGTTLTDATSNNNSGTINGSTWNSRTGGNTYDWGSGDWGSPQSQDDTNNNYDEVIIGQNLNHLMDSSEEARYIMDGNTSESQLHDDSGNGNHSVSTNNINFTGEPYTRFRGAYRFNGSDSYVELPSTIQDTTNTVATELWFYPRSTGTQQLVESQDFYTIYFDRNGNQGINIGVYGDNATLGQTGLALDTWHHINMYWEVGSEIGVSIDGAFRRTYSTSQGVSTRSNPMYLGRENNSNSDNFDGILTELRFVADERILTDNSLYQTDGTLLTGMKS